MLKYLISLGMIQPLKSSKKENCMQTLSYSAIYNLLCIINLTNKNKLTCL